VVRACLTELKTWPLVPAPRSRSVPAIRIRCSAWRTSPSLTMSHCRRSPCTTVYPGVGWVLWRDKAHLPGGSGQRMLIARAMTKAARARDTSDSTTIISLAQTRTADTSVGLKASAVLKDKTR